MNLIELFSQMTTGEIAGWGIVALALILSLIQISPLKINPWDSIFGWVGKKVNGKMQKQLEALQKQVNDLWINAHRQSILTFARECRADFHHDAEEWNHILAVADEYEQYCLRNTVSNGVVKADTQYIRDLYQQLSREHRI